MAQKGFIIAHHFTASKTRNFFLWAEKPTPSTAAPFFGVGDILWPEPGKYGNTIAQNNLWIVKQDDLL